VIILIPSRRQRHRRHSTIRTFARCTISPELPSHGDSEPIRDDKLRELDPGEFQISDLAPQSPAPPPRDFRITEAHRIGRRGLKEKARDNIAAIRTLRQVEDESREARESEKAVLARYSGWGALSNVFHPYPAATGKRLPATLKNT